MATFFKWVEFSQNCWLLSWFVCIHLIYQWWGNIQSWWTCEWNVSTMWSTWWLIYDTFGESQILLMTFILIITVEATINQLIQERLNDERDLLLIPSNKRSLPSPMQSMSQVTCNKYCQVFLNFIESTLETKKLEEYFYEITKFLLLFHPTTQTFISRRPSSFYWSNSWGTIFINVITCPHTIISSIVNNSWCDKFTLHFKKSSTYDFTKHCWNIS